MSEGKKIAFEVKWRIENIESWLRARQDILYSPQFIAGTLMNTRWKLSLSTSWQLAEKYLSLAVQRDVEDDGPEVIALKYELSFLTCDDLHIKSKLRNFKFAPKSIGHELNVKQVEILNEKSKKFVIESGLTVSCKFWYVWSSISKSGRCSIQSVIGKKHLTLDGAIENFNGLQNSRSVFILNFTSPSSEISLISFEVYTSSGTTVHFERKKVECMSFSSYYSRLNVVNNRGDYQFYLACITMFLALNQKCAFQSELDTISRYCLPDGTLKLQLQITYSPGVKSECIEYDDYNYKNTDDESVDQENVKISDSKKLLSDHLGCSRPSGNENKSCNNEEKISGEENECFELAGKKHLPTTTFKEDMASLFNDRLFCDIKLQNDTETFPAHRSVLCARSPVFKKMFTTDMKEAAGGCINVPDINSDTLRRMLQFLYTDCTGDLEMQSAMDLYVVSDKYDIVSLKERCSSFIKESLCPSNVCEVLVLADMHQDKDVESAAHEFIFTYDKEVFSSEEWKIFMKKFSIIATQVMYLKCMKQ